HTKRLENGAGAAWEPVHNRPVQMNRRHFAGLVAGGAVLAACGSDSGSDNAASDSAAPEEPTGTAPPDDFIVDPESNIDTNVLPDLVVDNVSDGNKVNLRNTFPAEQPVLLWMYAPH
ncbi:MAG: hypothetical protein AAFY28_20275, partial [Actinomycetota bacterium]